MPRLVWIDGDIDLIDAVVAPLEAAGYKIVRLRSAQAARERIETLRQADLILLEPLLPQVIGSVHLSGKYPGRELLQDLRKQEHMSTLVLVFTTVRNEELYRQLHALGVVDIVHKPVLPSDLKLHVDHLLRRPA